MANYADVKAIIDTYIKRNGIKAITGNILNGVLTKMLNELGAGYQYGGMAVPATDPDAPDYNVVYLAATAGTYAFFDGITLADGEIALLKYNGSWAKETVGSFYSRTDVDTMLEDYVQKVPGKGLSTNDYTDEDKAKLEGIEPGAQVNVLEGVSVNGYRLQPDENKVVDVDVPTDLSELREDAEHRLVTDDDITNWDAKYAKPAGGIPAEDLAQAVQDLLALADSSLQPSDIVQETGEQTDKVMSQKAVTDAVAAVDAEVSQLGQELYDFETVDGMQLATITNQSIAADGALSSGYNYRACAIPNNGYTRIVGHGSSYNGYLVLAFYNSATPNSSSFISGVTEPKNYTDKSFDEEIPAGTVTIVVGYSIVSPATVAVATLYKKTKITDNLEQEISDLQQDVEDIQQDITDISQSVSDLEEVEETVNQLIESEYPALYTEDDFTLDGYYNNANSRRTSGYGYTSLPLINVRKGMTIYWHKWATNSAISAVGALWCYDNDGLPFDGGNNARIPFAYLTTKDYDNGEFTYIIPEGCTQIGISFAFGSYPVQDGAYIQIGDTEISLTDKMKELVNLAVEQNEVTGDKSAKYYLKGNSNIVYSSSKKLGIIAAGQSNIDGRNSYSDLPPGFVNPNAKVRFCNNTSGAFSDFQVVDGGAGNDWSFDAIVYDLLTRTTYGNLPEIYVMKKSMGGTSIDKDGATSYHWTADYEYLSSETYSLLRSFEKTIRKGEDTQGTNFEIKAFLWHQGEGDADTEAVALRYYDNLKNMLAYVRGIVGNPRLDFFCGNLSENNLANPYVSIINDAYAQLASEDTYFHCVDMRNAVLEDSWHFNYQWSIYFGQKVYDLMIDAGIITGTKINPSEPS